MNLNDVIKLKYCKNCIDEPCLYHCPAFEFYKNTFFSPKNRGIVLENNIKKNKFNNDLLYYSCLHCNICKKRCPHNVDLSKTTLFAKREAIIFEDSCDYVNEFEEEFYKKNIKIDKKLNALIDNKSKILFIPSYDDLNMAQDKLYKLYKIFNELELSVRLESNFFDSNLDLYLLGYSEEMISDLKTWLKSIKDINLIVTSSFKIIHIFKIAKKLNIKIPKTIDILTFLNKHNFNFKTLDNSLLFNNFLKKDYIDFSYFNIKKLMKYNLDSTYLRLNYNLNKRQIEEINNNLIKNIDLENIQNLIFYDETSKDMFYNHFKNLKLMTILDLIIN